MDIVADPPPEATDIADPGGDGDPPSSDMGRLPGGSRGRPVPPGAAQEAFPRVALSLERSVDAPLSLSWASPLTTPSIIRIARRSRTPAPWACW